MTYLRYRDDIETPEPDEQETIDGRPLGSAMRTRLQVYRALSAFRHRENGVAEENTADTTAIPA